MCVHVQMLSSVQLFEAVQTVVCQTVLSMGFPRHEYWSGLPFPSPGDLPHPGIQLRSPAVAGGFFTTEPPGKPTCNTQYNVKYYANSFYIVFFRK